MAKGLGILTRVAEIGETAHKRCVSTEAKTDDLHLPVPCYQPYLDLQTSHPVLPSGTPAPIFFLEVKRLAGKDEWQISDNDTEAWATVLGAYILPDDEDDDMMDDKVGHS